MDINSGPTTLLNVANRLAGQLIPTPENQWTGLNRGGYASAEWDRLASTLLTSLEEARRVEVEREMLRQFTNDIPLLPLYFGLESLPIGGGLAGLQPIRGNPHTGTILHTWNVHEWTLRG
jgi:peptide/nickel transport system substrate-binding protein